eukprot:TRINITY_DN8523_c0_g1_i1.p1 TRINITY_DN8523_c0_g1~~TRINITY_DN8523_c0_g1_i1.p1  ORF type:complete len:737 (-),score=189.53 TRINITY_DN8523_c0_g1_i1:48-2258(-)
MPNGLSESMMAPSQLAVSAGDIDSDPMVEAEAATCFNCGNVLMADAVFCRKCGHKKDMMQSLQDPDQVITFLCRKFSGLIDRVRVAENRQAEVQQRAAALGAQFREATEQRQAAISQMQSALRAHLAEGENAQQRLSAARAAADFAGAELRRAREATLSMNEQCEELNSRCQEEQRSAQDAAGRVAQEDEALAACARERDKLKEMVEAALQELAVQEEEMATGLERDRHRRGDIRALEQRLYDAGRHRQVAEKRAQSGEEEVANTTKQVSIYRERLEASKATLQQSQEELRQEVAQNEDLTAENMRTEHEAHAAKEGLEKLRQMKTRLEASLRENIDVHSQLKASKLSCRSTKDANAALDARQKEIVGRLSATAECIARTTAEVDRWQQRLQGLNDSVRQLKSTQQDLEEVSSRTGSAGVSLQEELQRVFSMTEKLRGEREEAANDLGELQRKLRVAEPALETARRRTRDLEENLEDMAGEVTRAKQRKESLLREVSQCREKMRGLRKRHSSLSEKSQALEKRLVRSSGSFGGTAGFAAAAANLLAASSPTGFSRNSGATRSAPQLPPPTVVRQPPVKLAQVDIRSNEAASCLHCGNIYMADSNFCRHCGHSRRDAEGQVSPAASLAKSAEAESLGYLKQWVELEEVRLGVARTPPQPSPAPWPSTLDHPPTAGEVEDVQQSEAVEPDSPSAQRSAAALAALSAGAEPREALAMLYVEPAVAPEGEIKDAKISEGS